MAPLHPQAGGAELQDCAGRMVTAVSGLSLRKQLPCKLCPHLLCQPECGCEWACSQMLALVFLFLKISPLLFTLASDTVFFKTTLRVCSIFSLLNQNSARTLALQVDPVSQPLISCGDGRDALASKFWLAQGHRYWCVSFANGLHGFGPRVLAAASAPRPLGGRRSLLLIHFQAGFACLFVYQARRGFHGTRGLVGDGWRSSLAHSGRSGLPLSCSLSDGLISYTFGRRTLFKISRYGRAIVPDGGCPIIIS